MTILPKIITRTPTRRYCTHRNIASSIYISKCRDIFTNLALEDWLYKNKNFSNEHLLMLWRNEPCVVIGRHQNPWLECNFATLPSLGVKLARRNSGGGTVYHDLKNLNFTFFTSRGEYSRRRNLEFISRALKSTFNIDSEITKREDLCIDERKISGTASKLGRTSAYHHCTLLVNADKSNLKFALKNILGENVKTNATVSVKSDIMNISDVQSSVTVDQVMDGIVSEYRNTGCSGFNGVEMIEDIDDEHFPGVSDIKNMFLSDQWRFERTPKFTISRDLPLGAFAFLVVEKGKSSDGGVTYKDVILSIKNNNLDDLSELFDSLIDRTFTKDVLDDFEMVVQGLRNSNKCQQMVTNR